MQIVKTNQTEIVKSIKVLYEDEYLAVIEKPSGLVVNVSLSQKNNLTLQNWLEDINWIGEANSDSDFAKRCGIVHRLDKETSGVMIIAKKEQAFIELQRQFKEREIKKTYLTLVYGEIKDLKIGEKLTIDAPIGRNPKNRERFAVVEDGRAAITSIKLIEVIAAENGEKFSLLECYPETGRTHQIRVHLTALGYSVIGDQVYSGRNRIKRNKSNFNRQFLHAAKIAFTHPITKEKLTVTSDLPDDLLSMINFIKKESLS